MHVNIESQSVLNFDYSSNVNRDIRKQLQKFVVLMGIYSIFECISKIYKNLLLWSEKEMLKEAILCPENLDTDVADGDRTARSHHISILVT